MLLRSRRVGTVGAALSADSRFAGFEASRGGLGTSVRSHMPGVLLPKLATFGLGESGNSVELANG